MQKSLIIKISIGFLVLNNASILCSEGVQPHAKLLEKHKAEAIKRGEKESGQQLFINLAKRTGALSAGLYAYIAAIAARNNEYVSPTNIGHIITASILISAPGLFMQDLKAAPKGWLAQIEKFNINNISAKTISV